MGRGEHWWVIDGDWFFSWCICIAIVVCGGAVKPFAWWFHYLVFLWFLFSFFVFLSFFVGALSFLLVVIG